jgi:hypothetical protein
LEIILDTFEAAALPVHLLYQGGGRVQAKVRTFVDFCASRFLQDPALQRAGSI